MAVRRRRRLSSLALAIVAVVAIGLLYIPDIPFHTELRDWAIAIYGGPRPLDLAPISPNPILTASTAGPGVNGVADPFLVVDEGRWLVFFEVVRRAKGMPSDAHGVIGLATSTDEGMSWHYHGVVIEEPFHLSYPQVFKDEGEWYLVPESLGSSEVRLYRAERFPELWVLDSVLISGEYSDPTIFRHAGKWWVFVVESGEINSDTLRLSGASDLRGPWNQHPLSPIVRGDISRARPAGSVVIVDGAPIRFAMDNREEYGRAVRAFRLTTLSDTAYSEVEALERPVLTGSGSGWNADGMHHIAAVQLDDGRWVASVDGFRWKRYFGLDY